MAENKNTLREWSERLEAGERDDELLAVAARLERASHDEYVAPSVEFRRQLRRDLLNQYETPAARPSGRLWRFAGSVAAIGLLAALVVITWLTMSSAGRRSFGGVPALEGAATPVYIPTAPVDAAALGAYAVNAPDGLAPGRSLEVIARWHIPAYLGPAAAFAQVHNDAGQIIAQANGPIQPLGSEAFESNLAIPLPDTLPDGGYTVVFGLLDATGARVPLYDFAHSTVVYEESTPPLVVGSAAGAAAEVTLTPTPRMLPQSAHGGDGSAAGEIIATPTPPGGAATEAASTSSLSYHFLGYSTNGGTVTEQVTEQTETGETVSQTETYLLVPGLTMTVTLRWSLSSEAAGVSAFVHLLDSDGQVVAQADGPVLAATEPTGAPFAATLALNLPADLPAGEYDLVAGLYDPATGARLPVTTDTAEQDQSMRVLLRGDYKVSDNTTLKP